MEALATHLEVAFILSLATVTEDKSLVRARGTLRSTCVVWKLVAVIPGVAVQGIACP